MKNVKLLFILIGTALAGVIFLVGVWYWSNAAQKRAEKQAIQEIDTLLGPWQVAITMDDGWLFSNTGVGAMVVMRSQGNNGLNGILGSLQSDEYFFYRVEEVHIFGDMQGIDDRFVEPLLEFSHLKELRLPCSEISSNGMGKLKAAFPKAIITCTGGSSP